ncbi:MAG: hypothetical protein ACI4C7_00895 [Clostridia bacterium]
MKVKRITSIDTALRIYYTYPEIGNKEMRELFGNTSNDTISRYKKAVREEQDKRKVRTSQMNTINTEVAYDVWGIDVKDLERRRDKLKRLGLSA